ncbi:MAG: hypothetical protein AB1938_24085 [Myxococcota bacterium]
MPEGRYRSEEPRVLEGLEAVRKRPHLFVGDVGRDESVTAILLEPLCLAVDEHTGGPARHVEVRLLGEDVAEVVNDGPGLPLGLHPTEKVSWVELIMTRLYACREAKAEEQHKRWCSAGVCVVTALSAWCVVTVRRDGGTWEQRFERGQTASGLRRVGDTSSTGTAVRFELDRTLVTGRFDATGIRARLEQFTADFPCVAVALSDGRPGR